MVLLFFIVVTLPTDKLIKTNFYEKRIHLDFISFHFASSGTSETSVFAETGKYHTTYGRWKAILSDWR